MTSLSNRQIEKIAVQRGVEHFRSQIRAFGRFVGEAIAQAARQKHFAAWENPNADAEPVDPHAVVMVLMGGFKARVEGYREEACEVAEATADELHAARRETLQKERERRKLRPPTPAGGEAPSNARMASAAMVSPAITDADRPRHARITGDLPRSVQRLAKKDPKTGKAVLTLREVAALSDWADDFRYAYSGGISGQTWGERVDGGDSRERSITADQAEARNRLQRCSALLGEDMEKILRAVMVDGRALDQGAESAGFTGARQNMALYGKAGLVMAARRLAEFYATERG